MLLKRISKCVAILPKCSRRLVWQKSLTDRLYRKLIKSAQKEENFTESARLQGERQWAISLIEEEEDELYSEQLIRQARRLRVPVPHQYNQDRTVSECWYEGAQLGGWNLTDIGWSRLRDEVRKELRARHELRVQWLAWITPFIGIIGVVVGAYLPR